ncbi:hypothetical protein SUGI_0682680 [Cryptomeria japonica]|nr:hypothetical protein SUGI_0682680 [Cryptomeria japonica]
MYVRSNEKTVDFFNFWYRSKKDYRRKNEQQVLNLLKWEEFRRRRLKFEFLDTKYFGGYCERTKDVNSVCTMHANCCELGLKAKVIDLRNTLSDWEKYKQQEKLGKGKDVQTHVRILVADEDCFNTIHIIVISLKSAKDFYNTIHIIVISLKSAVGFS